jgi:hypothetical protein
VQATQRRYLQTLRIESPCHPSPIFPTNRRSAI